jgi:hypothetical protein
MGSAGGSHNSIMHVPVTAFRLALFAAYVLHPHQLPVAGTVGQVSGPRDPITGRPVTLRKLTPGQEQDDTQMQLIPLPLRPILAFPLPSTTTYRFRSTHDFRLPTCAPRGVFKTFGMMKTRERPGKPSPWPAPDTPKHPYPSILTGFCGLQQLVAVTVEVIQHVPGCRHVFRVRGQIMGDKS